MGKSNRVFSEQEIKKMVVDYEINKLSTADIAKSYGVDYSVIKKVLTSNGTTIINGSAFSLEYWLKRGLSKEEAANKIKKFKPVYVEYWLNKGFTEEEAKLKINEQAMKTESAFILKYGESGADKYKEKKKKQGELSPRKKEYWLKKGYNETEAKNMLSKSQAVFSKKILIEKFGVEHAEKILNDRNNKWQKTLKEKENYEDIQKRKDACSIPFLIEKYGDEYIDYFFVKKIKNLFNVEIKNLIIKALKENEYKTFLKIIGENFSYNSKFLYRISNIIIFSHVFNKTAKEIKNDLYKMYSVRNKNSYGTTYLIDGRIVRSLAELKIYEYLTENKINFEYDFLYPNQKTAYKCDFYLKDVDIYIEYAGMKNIKRRPQNEKILDGYDTRLKLKKNICVENNLKHYYSNSVDEILKFIKDLYEQKN